MLTSKELMAQTGVSRATLNNYIALGLLPKPVVKHPEDGNSKARRIGYFPLSAADKIRKITKLKKDGVRMADIVVRLAVQARESRSELRTERAGPTPPTPQRSRQEGPKIVRQAEIEKPQEPAEGKNNRGLRLTIETLEYPAYLVNNKFEVEWSNAAADTEIFHQDHGLSSDISDRNVFRLLYGGPTDTAESRNVILQFHLAIAKNRMTKASLLTADRHLEEKRIEELASLYDKVDPVESRAVRDTFVNLAPRVEEPSYYRLYATFFREGIFFAYAPSSEEESSLISILARRDLVIRDLLRNRKPYMTPLAVLVADIQNSVKICAELPPEEYFELINQVWGAMEPKFRKYYATHGKHVGDGIVYYFFPQPDCNYVLNAVRCACEMQTAMAAIDAEWRERKNWTNELKLNIGLDEGQEWFGAYQTPTHLEFSVLGDTINRAARLSDFARNGSIWVTKNMLAGLSSQERDNLNFGIRREGVDGSEVVVSSTYGRVSNLIDLEEPGNAKLQDIGVLPVTEILAVQTPET